MYTSVMLNCIHICLLHGQAHRGNAQKQRRRLLSGKTLIAAGLLLLGYSANAQFNPECGSLRNANGPWDYTNSKHVADDLPIVEHAHFTHEVEILQGHDKCGGDGCQVPDDISYTLRSFPNHHRALVSMVNYHLQGKAKGKRRMDYSAECFFDRALRFKPDDGMVHLIYGYFLSKTASVNDALQEYLVAIRLIPDSAEAHYNLGLLYTKIPDYPLARKHAYRAYELGFPLMGLKNILDRAGDWPDPENSEPLANN